MHTKKPKLQASDFYRIRTNELELQTHVDTIRTCLYFNFCWNNMCYKPTTNISAA